MTEPDKKSAETEQSEPSRNVGRRSLLGAIGAGAAGLALGGASGFTWGKTRSQTEPTEIASTYPFEGEHQAGITTEAQDRMHFAAFDMVDGATREDVIAVLKDWTQAARRLVLGGETTARGAFGGGPNFPPDDTGEAYDLDPAGLTLTFGFGRSLFVTADGKDRFGLRKHMPKEFIDMPVMTNDFLDPHRCGGDLCIQACADDPQVAVHAIRNLTRIGVGKTRIKWSQLGLSLIHI